MKINIEVENFFHSSIKKHEGLVLTPYNCPAGKLTIGYGTNIESIDKAEAEMLYQYRIGKVIKELNKKLKWVENLNPVRRWVLYEMGYNIGVAGLLKFKKTLYYSRNGKHAEASIEMLDSAWARQLPKRSKKLSNLYRKGKIK